MAMATIEQGNRTITTAPVTITGSELEVRAAEFVQDISTMFDLQKHRELPRELRGGFIVGVVQGSRSSGFVDGARRLMNEGTLIAKNATDCGTDGWLATEIYEVDGGFIVHTHGLDGGDYVFIEQLPDTYFKSLNRSALRHQRNRALSH